MIWLSFISKLCFLVIGNGKFHKEAIALHSFIVPTVYDSTGAVDLREVLQAEMRETPKGTVWQDENYKQAQDDNDILGRDPTKPDRTSGTAGRPEATTPISSPPPNGDVCVTNHKTT
jgi:hypothetical protein